MKVQYIANFIFLLSQIHPYALTMQKPQGTQHGMVTETGLDGVRGSGLYKATHIPSQLRTQARVKP
jgi:hypothetical protein